jgi:lysophospholipid acyltransferase (LPLAT)-like uncharacterized protein
MQNLWMLHVLKINIKSNQRIIHHTLKKKKKKKKKEKMVHNFTNQIVTLKNDKTFYMGNVPK